MKHCMIDLETVGQSPRAGILSLAAVFFVPETGELGNTFFAKINPIDSFKFGEADGSTFKWWMTQSNHARIVAVEGTAGLSISLGQFSTFLSACPQEDLRVWGNGATFDLTILEHAYDTLQISRPWTFRAHRDVRTVKDIAEDLFKMPSKPIDAHNALVDAVFQAKWVSTAWQALRNSR